MPIASRPSSITSLKGDTNLQVVETPSFQNLVALLNTASGPLADPNVRMAVAKAFDVNGIAAALAGSVVPAKGVIPEGLIGYSDTLTGTGLDLDGCGRAAREERLRSGRQAAHDHRHDRRRGHRRAARDDQPEVEPRQAEHHPRRPGPPVAGPVGQGEVDRRRQSAGRLHHVLVARLRRPVQLVHLALPHRGDPELQPRLLLEPDARRRDRRDPGARPRRTATRPRRST